MITIEKKLKLLSELTEPEMETDEFLENLDLVLKKKRQAFNQEDRKRSREGRKKAETRIRQFENKLKLQELEALEAKMRYDGDESAHHLLLSRRKILLDCIGDEPRIEVKNLTGSVTYVFAAKDLPRIRSQLAVLLGTLPSTVRLVHNTTGQDVTQDQVPSRSGEVLRLTAVNMESQQERALTLRQDLKALVPFVSLRKIVEITIRAAVGDQCAGLDLFKVLENFSLQKPDEQKEDDDLWKAAMSRPAFGEEQLLKVFKIVKQAFGLEEYGEDYFRVAIERDSHRLLEAILAAGADPNVGHKKPLWLAIDFGRVQMVSALLDANADANDERYDVTPLMWAVQNDNTALITELLRSNADPDLASQFETETPLIIAIGKNRVSALEELLRLGANPNFDPCDDAPLNFAIGCGHDDVVTLLLENDADPNFDYPLIHALRYGRDSMVAQLLKRNADPNLSRQSMNPLIQAIKKDKHAMVAQLLQAKADPNLDSGMGTPLNFAISKGISRNEAIVKQLRDAGAGQKKKTETGR